MASSNKSIIALDTSSSVSTINSELALRNSLIAAKALNCITRIASERTERDDEDLDLLTPPGLSRFNANHFSKASEIIRALKEPHLNIKRPSFRSDDERIKSYELIVGILKYSTFLADALQKSRFFKKHPDMGEEEVMVVLYHLLERDFRVNPIDTPLSDKFAEIQNAVLTFRTKIMAHMARIRIKYEANSIDHLLPENLRHQHHIDKNPLYAWINLKKISSNEVKTVLERVGLRQTEFEDDILIQEKMFCVVQAHPDLLRFHSKKSEMIHALPLVKDGKIIIQDKSACICIYALVKSLFFKEAMHRNNGLRNLNPVPIPDSFIPITNKNSSTEWYDGLLDGSGKHYLKPDSVIVTHCGSGRSAAHLACLLLEAVPRYISKSVDMVSDADLYRTLQTKFVSRPPLIVHAFGVPKQKHAEVSRVFRKQLGLTNFRLYTQAFCDVSKKDDRLKGVVAILVNPPSSGSALMDPVSYVCSEGGDENVLSHLSKFVTSTLNTEGQERYTADQSRFLSYALSFSQAKLVMYTTCSSLPCENSDVVETCLADARGQAEAKKAALFANIMINKQIRNFMDVSYEVVNLAQVMDGYPDSQFQGKFIEIPPSSASSGVFVALIRRREKSIQLGKNPFRLFIESQLALAATKSKLESSPTSTASLSGISVSSFPTERVNDEDLARYIARKMNIHLESPEVRFGISESGKTAVPLTATSSVVTKRKFTKKAIVQRVSVPTYSSLSKKTDKWMGSTSSNSRTVSKTAQGVKSKASQAGTSGRKPFGNVASTIMECTHDPGACVCSRHAKKFPDFLRRK